MEKQKPKLTSETEIKKDFEQVKAQMREEFLQLEEEQINIEIELNENQEEIKQIRREHSRLDSLLWNIKLIINYPDKEQGLKKEKTDLSKRKSDLQTGFMNKRRNRWEIERLEEEIETKEGERKSLVDSLNHAKRIIFEHTGDAVDQNSDLIRVKSEIERAKEANLQHNERFNALYNRNKEIQERKIKLVWEVLNGEALRAAGINLEDTSHTLEVFGYGGSRWETQFCSDAYKEVDKIGSVFESMQDLPPEQENITFGICEIKGIKSIILRQRQTLDDRGGYSYTLLASFDDNLWEKFDWNGMSIIKAILNDPIMKFLFLKCGPYIPWVLHGNEVLIKRVTNLIFWLESNFREIIPLENVAAGTIENIENPEKEPTTKEIPPEEANPEHWARVLAALPESVRKKVRIFIGNAGRNALDWGVKTMFFSPKRS